MLVTILIMLLLASIATVSVIGGLLTVNKAGEKDGICSYEYTEN